MSSVGGPAVAYENAIARMKRYTHTLERRSHVGHRDNASRHADVHQECPRRPLPCKRCCPLRHLLYPASRVQGRASATSGIRQCVARRFTHPAEWSGSVWLSADAERSASRAWGWNRIVLRVSDLPGCIAVLKSGGL